MAKVSDVAAYLCKHYPAPVELSKARLTKMVYLADWKHSVDRSCQITSIEWQFNHYGPYVDDVISAVRADPRFQVLDTKNIYGDRKEQISLLSYDPTPCLNIPERETLDFVIASTSPKNWNNFIRLVYSTYPVVTQPKYTALNLVELAAAYRVKIAA